MGVVWMEGFDTYTNATDMALNAGNFSSVHASIVSNVTSYLVGRSAMFTDSGQALISRTYTNTQDVKTIIVGGWHRISTLPASNKGLVYLDAQTSAGSSHSTGSIIVVVTPTGVLEMYCNNGTTYTQSTYTLPVNTWTHIELQAYFGNSIGVLKLYVNGVLAIDQVNIDTIYSSYDRLYRVQWHGVGSGNSYLDHAYMIDPADGVAPTAPVGPVLVETLLPTADTAVADWTAKSAGAHYVEVDDPLGATHDGDGTYNESATDGHRDLYDVPALSYPVGTVYGVGIRFAAKKLDGSSTEILPLCKGVTTVGVGEAKALGTSYATYDRIFRRNPDDSAPFESADITAMQIGMELNIP